MTLPDLSRYKAEPTAGQKRPSASSATSESKEQNLFTTSNNRKTAPGGAAKALRINALYPEFHLSEVQETLAKHNSSAAHALSDLGKRSLDKKVSHDSLSSEQKALYKKFCAKFDEFRPESVLATLASREWDEIETTAHLSNCRKVRNNSHAPVPVKKTSAPEEPTTRQDFASPNPDPVRHEAKQEDDGEGLMPKPRKFRRGLSAGESSGSSSPSASAVSGTHPTRASSNRMDRPHPGATSLRTSTPASPLPEAKIKSEAKEEKRPAPVVVPDESEDEDDVIEAVSSNDDGDSDADDGGARKTTNAIEWFNNASESALCETIGCSAAQASKIVSLRPFEDEDDVDNKLGDRANKGVTPRLFHACVEVMAGYQQVDKILHRVEGVGRRLLRDIQRWALDTPHNEGGGKRVAPSQARKEGYIAEQPEGLSEQFKLKPYQLTGVNWLSLLYNHQLSAILADEMGLGKTVQVISFLLALKARGEPGPHLVVAPSSVLENWRRELDIAANPSREGGLHVAVYWGSQKERDLLRDQIEDQQDGGELDVVLTTYDMASAGGSMGKYDARFFRRRNFNVCIFDEGHMLKNRRSERYQKLMRIPAHRRLLLTGTPLQNHLGELLSLLNFILPNYFSDTDSELLESIFKAKPSTTSSSNSNLLSTERVERAKALMKPFVLRRRKEKVLAHELAGKTERVVRCEMTSSQAQIYADVLAGAQQAVQQGEGENKGAKAQAASAAKSGHVLMDLRKAANHPLLFRRRYDHKKITALAKDYVKNPDFADEPLQHVEEDFAINSDASLSQVAQSYSYTKKHALPADAWLDSGKIQALKDILDEAMSRGERVLLFSQFTTVLDILVEALHALGIKYLGFTGATRVEDRQVLVDQFTKDDSISVFLLTTRAGGVGINLTAANWVVLFDQDFNPHNDKQAIDRAHRLGQKRNVTVIRLLSKGTIDDQIYALGTRKLELAHRVSDDQAGEVMKGEDEVDEAVNDDDIQKMVSTSIMAQIRAGGSPVKSIQRGRPRTNK